jgi:hypothetical protein
MNIWVVLVTAVHVGLCLAALLLGVRTVYRYAFARREPLRESAFLYTALAATLTGFVFPFHGVTPAIVIGLVSSAVLIVTLLARARINRGKLAAIVIFVAGLVITEYLLVFVTVAQAFTKVAALHVLAPTLKEVPFVLTQGLALVVFVQLTVLSVRRLTTHRIAGGP